MIKRFLLFELIFFCVVSFPQTSDYNVKVKKKIEAILKNNKFFNSSQISIDIFDLTDNKSVYQKNSKLLFLPASTLKLLTASAALIFLGSDYPFNTTLLIDGVIIDSTLYGSVIIRAGLDPLFTLDDLYLLANKLDELGLKTITGDLIADCSIKDSVFWGNGWQWDDEPSTDAPHLSALNINYNSISISARLLNKEISFSLFPKTDFVSVKSIADDSEEDISITRDWINMKNEILIFYDENFSNGKSYEETRSVNIINPEFYFLTLFKEYLLINGISIEGRLIKSFKSLSADSIFSVSRNITEVCNYLLKNSDNLTGEMLLYAIAAGNNSQASIESGLVKVDSLISLVGLLPSNFKIADGSGLSRYSLISSELLVDMLVYIYKNEPGAYKIIYEELPLAGIDGTLENRMVNTSAQNNVRAKTGTIAGVSALAGYLTNPDGHLIAFAMNIQNYIGGATSARKYIDSICEILTSTK